MKDLLYDEFDFSQADPLFVEVARFVVENNRMAMGSPIERKFEIGFNRSRRILEQLEAAGIVGEAVRYKPRTVLCTTEELEQKLTEWQK